MNDVDFKNQLLIDLDILDATPEQQDTLIAKVEEVANKRFANLLPDLLSDKQLAEAEAMQTAGKSDEEIVAWIQGQLPKYKETMQALMLDIAEEMAPE